MICDLSINLVMVFQIQMQSHLKDIQQPISIPIHRSFSHCPRFPTTRRTATSTRAARREGGRERTRAREEEREGEGAREKGAKSGKRVRAKERETEERV